MREALSYAPLAGEIALLGSFLLGGKMYLARALKREGLLGVTHDVWPIFREGPLGELRAPTPSESAVFKKHQRWANLITFAFFIAVLIVVLGPILLEAEIRFRSEAS